MAIFVFELSAPAGISIFTPKRGLVESVTSTTPPVGPIIACASGIVVVSSPVSSNNGIQDIALAFEPGEGDELKRPPRSPNEAIFNRLMIERVLVSALFIGIMAFLVFKWLLASGFTVEEARNGTLLLMVLFENVHVFNCRSETRSLFRHNLLRNKILLVGTLVAQLVHIGAMYTPWISDVLHIQPVSLQHWAELFFIALGILVVMELHKLVRQKLAA